MKKHIPNFITLLNLISGFIAIIMVIENQMIIASYLIFIAVLFDFLDGFVARFLNTHSPIGKSLDSLADLVSFGIAPGVIIYHSVNIPAMEERQYLFLMISSLIPVFGAIRLAIFDNDQTQKSVFRGLPVPAAAILIVSLVLIWNDNPDFMIPYTQTSLISISVIASMLMVIPIRMLSIKFKSLKLKDNMLRYSFLFLCLTMLILFKTKGIFYGIILYVLISVVLNVIPTKIENL